VSDPEYAPRSHEEIVVYLQQCVGALVGVSAVQPQDNLFDIGMESLMLVDIKDSVRETLGVSLKFADFFSHYTVADLATLIDQRQERVSA